MKNLRLSAIALTTAAAVAFAPLAVAEESAPSTTTNTAGAAQDQGAEGQKPSEEKKEPEVEKKDSEAEKKDEKGPEAEKKDEQPSEEKKDENKGAEEAQQAASSEKHAERAKTVVDALHKPGVFAAIVAVAIGGLLLSLGNLRGIFDQVVNYFNATFRR